MGKGRKRKGGQRRNAKGRILRTAADRVVKGNERAQAMLAIYGQDGADALGRAYQSGLLGTGSEAKNLLDTGRKVAKAYWQAYETGPIRCTLADGSGSGGEIDHDRIRDREEQLRKNLAVVDHMGRNVRRAFDQLVIDVNPDKGPLWLDRLVWAGRHRKMQGVNDRATLRAALDALEAIAY